ncbi:MAG: hypothetical protein Q9208_005175 [Pyrenodesmia sp. 3 TL-2023]
MAQEASTEEGAATYLKLANIAQTTKKRGGALQKQIEDLRLQASKTSKPVVDRGAGNQFPKRTHHCVNCGCAYTTVCERKGHMKKCNTHNTRSKPGAECKECKLEDKMDFVRKKDARKAAEGKNNRSVDWFKDASKSRKKPRVNKDWHVRSSPGVPKS